VLRSTASSVGPAGSLTSGVASAEVAGTGGVACGDVDATATAAPATSAAAPTTRPRDRCCSTLDIPSSCEGSAVRVLIAPDKFAGTLTAVEAAAAIEAGWRRRRPDDELSLVPMADGGPGFVDALHACLGGTLHALTVTGPLGRPTPATLLLTPAAADAPGRADRVTAYVESAQACGVALLPRADGDPRGRPEPDIAEVATTLGVGEMLRTALLAGATTVVVGLGGSGSNDAGAGLLAALGATSDPDGALLAGATQLRDLSSVDLQPALDLLGDARLVAASDVSNPLLGLRGATNVYGPQKGLTHDRLFAVDGALTHFAHLVDRERADQPGAGAAGGLGYALALLGAQRRPGLDIVAEANGMDARLPQADLVITGEGSLDPQTFTGKVVAGVAQRCAAAGVPCVAVAGRLEVGSRELRAAGIDGAYSTVDLVGQAESMQRPAESLAALAQRVARTWGR
jgi:glycerate kinase